MRGRCKDGRGESAVIREGLRPPLLALKVEETDHRPRMVGASGSWRHKKTDSPLEPPKGTQPC